MSSKVYFAMDQCPLHERSLRQITPHPSQAALSPLMVLFNLRSPAPQLLAPFFVPPHCRPHHEAVPHG